MIPAKVAEWVRGRSKTRGTFLRRMERWEGRWRVVERCEALSVVHRPRLYKMHQARYEHLCEIDPQRAAEFFRLNAYTTPIPPTIEEVEAKALAERHKKALAALEWVRLPADHPKKTLRRRV